MDINQVAVQLVEEKAVKAGLHHVDRFFACSIADFPEEEPFDVAIAMHACGAASDLAQQATPAECWVTDWVGAAQAALARGAPYVICPCCIGKLQV